MQSRGWNEWGTRNSVKDWHPNALLNGLGSDDFNEFVSRVVQARPGYVSELLFAYTKPGISFVGKQESIRNDLVCVLDLLGLPYNRASIESSPKVNVSEPDQSELRWDPQLRETVKRLELPALLHFGYLDEKEKDDLGVCMTVEPSKALNC